MRVPIYLTILRTCSITLDLSGGFYTLLVDKRGINNLC